MTALYAALIFAGQPTQAPTSNDIIAKTLQKYADAKSAVADLTMVQSTGSKKVTINTSLQFERSNKIFLHQSSEAIAPGDWLLVSDGANFGYDVPGNPTGPRRRLFEPVNTLKVHSLYLAAKRSLGDNTNPYIEFMTQSAGDNQSLKGFLSRLRKIGTATEKTLSDGSTGYSIPASMMFGNAILDEQGKPKVDAQGNEMFESAGRCVMEISKDFTLVSFKTTENVSITDTATNLPVQSIVITTWTGKVQLDATPNADIFKVK